MTLKQSEQSLKFGKIELDSPLSDSLTDDEKSESDMFKSEQADSTGKKQKELNEPSKLLSPKGAKPRIIQK